VSQLNCTSDPASWTDTELLDFLQEAAYSIVIEQMEDDRLWFMICEDADVSIAEDADLRMAIRKAAMTLREKELEDAS
jgi:hypothetical protein